MRTPSKRHPYQPFIDATKEIRLLQLHGKQENDQDGTIRCSLSHASLQRAEPFEALSYVWGATTSQQTILLDGLPFEVTRNLHTALTHLRRGSDTRYLWVDALCINQADDHERSSQVAQMQHIFRLARLVIVFLGDTWPGCDAVMDMMTAAGRDDTLHWDPALEPHINIHGMTASSDELRTHLITFFASPWWFRVWTVQEYCLASNVVLQYGSRSINNILLSKWYSNYISHFSTCCRGYQASFNRPVNDKRHEERVAESLRRLEALIRQRLTRADTSFIRIIIHFRFRLCLDPRDKIYGLLGLMEAGFRDRIHPDYIQSPKDLYLNVVLASIINTESLDILSCKYGSKTLELNLPSFVPDWTTHVSAIMHQAPYERLRYALAQYRASKDSIPDLQSTSPDQVLISGLHVDRIMSIARWGRPWKVMLIAWRELASTNPDVCPYSDRATAFWLTMCGGIFPDNNLVNFDVRPVNDDDLPSFYLWEAYVNSEFLQQPADGALDFHSSFYTVFAMRDFAVTEKGYLGWVPKESEEGDSVVLLSGGKVPYILRPVDANTAATIEIGLNTSKERSTSHIFTFVGDAYIQGMMQGECYDSDKLERFRLV